MEEGEKGRAPAGTPTARAVKRANIEVYNRKTVESYDENRSIFNPRRQEAIHSILRDLRWRTGGESFLDLGCGTGNLLRLARGIFKEAVGIDLASKLLVQLHRNDGRLLVAAGDSERIPFPDGRFDVVALYAVLHHIVEPSVTFREAFRCLKPGGLLYTDHDPNYFFHRFYHVYYRLRHGRRPGFGTEDEEIAEYHNTQAGGLNPEVLADRLREIGFRDVQVHYRMTDGEGHRRPLRLALKVIRGFAGMIPLKSLYTHFWIVAGK